MSDLDSIFSDARDDVSNWLENEGPDYNPNELTDRISEIADYAVPVYTHDIMCLVGDPRIYGRDSELGGDTLEEITKGQIYCAVEEYLHGEVEGMDAELFEDCPSCFTRCLISNLEQNLDGWCDDCTEVRDDDEEDVKTLPLFSDGVRL